MRAVLDGVRGLGLLVVDGYADLDPDGRPGLGAHAHAALGVPVIGVAKSVMLPMMRLTPNIGRQLSPAMLRATMKPPTSASKLAHRSGASMTPSSETRVDSISLRIVVLFLGG
jgi:deoxyribonuclease V